MKHTPGPWSIDWNISRLDIFSADAATMVCTLRRSSLSADLDDKAKANARLIAAAPDMLAALLYYRDKCSGAEPSLSVFHQMLDAAIEKATGGAS